MFRALFTVSLILHVMVASAVLSVDIVVLTPTYCVYSTGDLCAYASGGIEPYSVVWSNGENTACIYGLPTGTYSVTVYDANGDQATDQLILSSTPFPDPAAIWVPGCPVDVIPAAPPFRLFTYANILQNGTPPFTVNGVTGNYQAVNADGGYLYLTQYGPSGSDAQFNITDGFGCTSTLTTTVPQPPEWLVPQIMDVNGSCSGGSNGRIWVFVPEEANGWSSAFRLQNDGGYIPWSNTPPGNAAYLAGDDDRTFIAEGLAAGTYHLVQHTSWNTYGVGSLLPFWPFIEDECPDTLATIIVPDLGFSCGTVSGRVYIDGNEDCIVNGVEPRIPNTVIEALPGPYYGITNDLGEYSINVPYGTYTIADQNALYQEHCGVEGTPFTIDMTTSLAVRDLGDTSLVGLDMRLSIASSPARPGFELSYGIRAENLTGTTSGTGTVTFTFDPVLTFNSATPAPASVVGNTITWNLSTFYAFQSANLLVRLQVPSDVNLIGTVLLASGTLSTTNVDTDPLNNIADDVVVVTGAYDPNDKLARTSSGNVSSWSIGEDEWVDYTIRFQNTGTDTAFLVVITDTLPPNLDVGTLELGARSHDYNVSVQGQGIVRWMFPNILLPDSGTNEIASHGFVKFRIRPHLPVLPGELIENTANIYFDFNPPIITDPSVLVAEFSTSVQEPAQVQGQLGLLPNPAHDQLRIVADGSIDAVKILATDGREVLRRAIRSTSTSLDVSGLPDGSYIVVATLKNGNVLRERFIKQ